MIEQRVCCRLPIRFWERFVVRMRLEFLGSFGQEFQGFVDKCVHFAGTARTSLIVTIGPSPRHRGETTSTILFGQRVSPFHLSKM
jgi:hypothetical protein